MRCAVNGCRCRCRLGLGSCDGHSDDSTIACGLGYSIGNGDNSRHDHIESVRDRNDFSDTADVDRFGNVDVLVGEDGELGRKRRGSG